MVNSYSFMDYMVLTLKKDKTNHDEIFFADEKEPVKDEGMIAELHFVDMKTKAHNTDQYKTGYYDKSYGFLCFFGYFSLSFFIYDFFFVPF